MKPRRDKEFGIIRVRVKLGGDRGKRKPLATDQTGRLISRVIWTRLRLLAASSYAVFFMTV